MKYQNTLDDKVQCTICPRNCKLVEGQKGFCQVRENIKGNIVLTTYGYNTGLAVDPIEKKPLYHFYPGSKVLSFGTLGCNMGCLFCQNWHTTKTKVKNYQGQNFTEPKKIAQLAVELGCKSVAFTYNDPVIFMEYAIDTAKECRDLGIKTVAVTAGYMNPEPREEFYSYIDAVNVDLKGFSEEFYKKNCMAQLEPILDTIKYIKHKTNCWMELTTLLIEGENDTAAEVKKECEWIVENLGTDVPLHFSAFYPAYKFMDHRPTKFSTLVMAYGIAKNAGIKYVYTGNALDVETSTTYCDSCAKQLIKRNGFEVLSNNLEHGHCKFCGAKMAGVF